MFARTILPIALNSGWNKVDVAVTRERGEVVFTSFVDAVDEVELSGDLADNVTAQFESFPLGGQTCMGYGGVTIHIANVRLLCLLFQHTNIMTCTGTEELSFQNQKVYTRLSRSAENGTT